MARRKQPKRRPDLEKRYLGGGMGNQPLPVRIVASIQQHTEQRVDWLMSSLSNDVREAVLSHGEGPLTEAQVETISADIHNAIARVYGSSADVAVDAGLGRIILQQNGDMIESLTLAQLYDDDHRIIRAIESDPELKAAIVARMKAKYGEGRNVNGPFRG